MATVIELSVNQISIVKKVEDIDLVSLFNSSIDNMNNGTWTWPAEVDTNEKK